MGYEQIGKFEQAKEFLRKSLLYGSTVLCVGFGIVGLYGKIRELREPLDGIHGVKLVKIEHYKNHIGGDIHSYVEGDKIYVEGCKDPIYFSSIGEIPEGKLSILFKKRSWIFGGGLEGLSIGPYIERREDKEAEHLVTK